MTPGQAVEIVDQIVDEVLELRYGAAGDPEGQVCLPDAGTSVDGILASLLRVRKRLDRVEELLSTLIRYRGKLRREVEVLEAAAQEVWDETLVNDPRLNARDFVAPKERYAHANLASMTQRRQVLKAKDAENRADTAYEVVRQAHKGLDALRYDHVILLRAATLMSSLEG